MLSRSKFAASPTPLKPPQSLPIPKKKHSNHSHVQRKSQNSKPLRHESQQTPTTTGKPSSEQPTAGKQAVGKDASSTVDQRGPLSDTTASASASASASDRWSIRRGGGAAVAGGSSRGAEGGVRRTYGLDHAVGAGWGAPAAGRGDEPVEAGGDGGGDEGGECSALRGAVVHAAVEEGGDGAEGGAGF